MKTNDILVTAYPRSGITYLGFLLAAARLKHNGIDLVPTFYNIDWLLIDAHKMSGYTAASIWNDGVGDFWKTHAAGSGDLATLRELPNVIYLLRNPVDTLTSYRQFQHRIGAIDVTMPTERWLLGPQGAIENWKTHVKSWLIDNRNVSQSLYLLEYEALRAGTSQELWNIGHQLGFEWSYEVVEHALDMAQLDRMRNMERSFADHNPVYERYHLEFVRPERQEKEPRREPLTPQLIELIKHHTDDVYNSVRPSHGGSPLHGSTP